MGKILIFEEVAKLASLAQDYLKHNGFDAHCSSDYLEVVPWVRENAPCLVLLGLMLPGRAGIEIYREIRTFSDVPIIMGAARVDRITALLGSGLGPGDLVCEPLSPREIVARVKSALRRTQSGQANAARG